MESIMDHEPRQKYEVHHKPVSFWDERGRFTTWLVLSILYLGGVLVAIYIAVDYDYKLIEHIRPSARPWIVIGGLFFSVLPTLYWWIESHRFEKWVRDFRVKADENDVEYERKVFEMNRELARAFWAAVLAVFSVIYLKSQ